MNCYLFPVQFLGYGETPEEAWAQGLGALSKEPLTATIKYYFMQPQPTEEKE